MTGSWIDNSPRPTVLQEHAHLKDPLIYRAKKVFLGRPLNRHSLSHQRLSKVYALGILSSDCISSSAYGSEQMLIALLPAFGLAGFTILMPLTFVIISILALVTTSYRQVVMAYTKTGGSYIVARDNFGPKVAQIAAVALMIDYIVTVAIQTAAGTAALISAFRSLAPYNLVITLSVIGLLLYGNLRGVKEAGRVFAAPTYFFVTSVGMVILLGIIREFQGKLHHIVPAAGTFPLGHSQSLITAASALVLLRAFANGGSSLTGLEAISNGVSIFKAPEGNNARRTTVIMSNKLTNFISFNLITDPILGEEGYRLKVEKKGVTIDATNPVGLFYAVQTLFQLLPSQIMSVKKVDGIVLKMPAVKIFDKPRFSYRGMHLDVGRHFMPVEFIKQYIDLLAMFKLNTFHWHLTEDQGWRIEIKKYPKLALISSMRDETVVGHAGSSEKFDGIPHGGFYTQDQIKDVVAYASKRFITIIPEIEMPGHSLAVLAAYPQLSCTGGPFKVATSFGVFDDIFCAANDSTFVFLQDVLDEVMALFPSKYIHIGGDEAPKSRWHVCPKCQSLMKAEGLKDEHELQSYFIKRIEKYVVSKGRKIIGWDEILEGGLAPEATVMSWRGMDGGIAAAKQHHDVVMSANGNLYFDHYQADPATEPLAIGGYLPLRTVYDFEPIPAELSPEEAKHIIGAQGQIWTEYMKTPESVEYMLLPRLLALSEITWTSKENKNWYDFRDRLDSNLRRLAVMKLPYSQGSTKVEISAKAVNGGKSLLVTLEAERPNMIVRYNLDGNMVSPGSAVATKAIKIENSSKLYAAAFIDGQLKDKMINIIVEPHLAAYTEATIIRTDKPDLKPVSIPGIIDGFCGTTESDQGVWNSIQGKENQITIDLKKVISLNNVAIHFMTIKDGIYVMPESIEYQVSQDNKDYTLVAKIKNDLSADYNDTGVKNFTTPLNALKARYVRVIIKAESKSIRDPRLMVDEVVVK